VRTDVEASASTGLLELDRVDDLLDLLQELSARAGVRFGFEVQPLPADFHDTGRNRFVTARNEAVAELAGA
jgi:hypothetical protein